MMHVDQAIRRVNRDVIIVWAAHAGLALGVLGALIVGAFSGISPVLLAVIPCMLWILLAVNGVRETRNAMQWPALIASGRLDEAEKQIERTIRGFGVLRSVKLLSLHQLAVVKMAQRQWREALALSRAIARHRLPKDTALQRASLLVLAGAAVQTGDYQDAYSAISRLRVMPLTLDEQLSLLTAECTYCGRIGAWRPLADSLAEKSRMAELMPADLAAQAQAWLALAARRTGRQDWERYLVERCRLLKTPEKLYEMEPAFKALFEP